MTDGRIRYHLAAAACVGVWGATFVSTKVLLLCGLTPAAIFLVRFSIAYVGIWFVAPRRLRADSWRDEALMALLGVTGGSAYFLAENMAVGLAPASNVSLLITTAPVMTLLLLRLSGAGGPLTAMQLTGAGIALAGVGCVVFNGRFVLRLDPAGDLLALAAALSWACYSLLLRLMGGRYPAAFYTRKVFFYGVVTLLPWFLFVEPLRLPLATLAQPAVWGNLLFLGVAASLVCYVVWSVVIRRIGTMQATNYIYFNPLVTLLVAAAVLGERITPVAGAGAVLLIGGVWLAEKAQR